MSIPKRFLSKCCAWSACQPLSTWELKRVEFIIPTCKNSRSAPRTIHCSSQSCIGNFFWNLIQILNFNKYFNSDYLTEPITALAVSFERTTQKEKCPDPFDSLELCYGTAAGTVRIMVQSPEHHTHGLRSLQLLQTYKVIIIFKLVFLTVFMSFFKYFLFNLFN